MEINPQILFSNLRREKCEATHFHHLRVADPKLSLGYLVHACKGGATVAYWQPEPGVVLYAVAHCSPSGWNYNKKIGRAIAEGRLYSENHVQMYTLPTITEV